jgi:hypothetical protein
MSKPAFTNIHGRKGTRGVRPFLLVPKVLAVAVYFGGLTTAALIWFVLVEGDAGTVAARARRLQCVVQIGFLFRVLIVPALLVAMAAGVMLLLQHRRQFLHMRWLQVKLAVLALGVPGAHLYLSTRLRLVRLAAEAGGWDGVSAWQMSVGLVVVIVVSVAVIILGRQKPRLGQNWARAFAATQHATDETSR